MNDAFMNFTCKFLRGHMFSFLLGGYLGVELLVHFMVFEKVANSSKVTTLFHIPSSSVLGFCFLLSYLFSPNLLVYD